MVVTTTTAIVARRLLNNWRGTAGLRDGKEKLFILGTSPQAQHTDQRLTGPSYHTAVGLMPVCAYVCVCMCAKQLPHFSVYNMHSITL